MDKSYLRSVLRLVFLTFAFFQLNHSSTKAQGYYHAAGIGVGSATFSVDLQSSGINLGGRSRVTVPGLFYKSTYALTNRLAFSAYPFLGLSVGGSNSASSSGALGLQLPINAEVYFGDIDDKAFYVGAGAVYSFLTSEEEGDGAFFGPEMALGAQTYFNDRLLGARIAFAYGLNSTNQTFPSFTVRTQSLYSVTLGVYYSFNAR